MTDITTHQPQRRRHARETCATLLARAMGRRRLLAFGAGLLATTVPGIGGPGIARAQQQPPPRGYEAMLLMCIDPRFVRHTTPFMERRNLMDHYSQFALRRRRRGRRGAALPELAPDLLGQPGVVDPAPFDHRRDSRSTTATAAR